MKKTILIIFVMTCILSLNSNTALAVNSAPSSLQVMMKSGEEPLSGINVAICCVADSTQQIGLVTYNSTPGFAGADAVFSDLTKEKNIALAASLNAYAHANRIERSAKTTDSTGAATFTGLSAGLYMVAQMNPETSEFIIDPFLVPVPVQDNTNNSWEYNVTAYPKTEPVKRDNETVSVGVYKVWTETTNIPGNILVQLYRNGILYGNTVSLNVNNYWSHTWTDLEPGAVWTVDEPTVPAGFIKTISGSASTGFIITNARENLLLGKPVPYTPEAINPLPGNPVASLTPSPDKPEKPDASRPHGNIRIPDNLPPGGPENPEIPHINNTPDINDTNITDNPSPGGTSTPHSPRTSDDSNTRLWITLIACGTVGLFTAALAAFIFMRQKKTQ